MCNACGFLCCASDAFEGCGCYTCGDPDCEVYCDECGLPAPSCVCSIDDFEEDLEEREPLKCDKCHWPIGKCICHLNAGG